MKKSNSFMAQAYRLSSFFGVFFGINIRKNKNLLTGCPVLPLSPCGPSLPGLPGLPFSPEGPGGPVCPGDPRSPIIPGKYNLLLVKAREGFKLSKFQRRG